MFVRLIHPSPIDKASRRPAWGVRGGCSQVGLALTLSVYFVFAGSATPPAWAQNDDPQAFAEMADILGLEPSEFGRLRNDVRLDSQSPELWTAVQRLADLPFRQLHRLTAEPSPSTLNPGAVVGMTRITGRIVRIRRHAWEIPTSTQEGTGPPVETALAPSRDAFSGSAERPSTTPEDSPVFLYELWCQPETGTATADGPTDLGTPTADALVRILTLQVPKTWLRALGKPPNAAAAEWELGPQEPILRASAWWIPLGRKQPLGRLSVPIDVEPAGNLITGQEASPPNSDQVRLATGLAKRVEWIERDAATIHRVLLAGNTAQVGTTASPTAGGQHPSDSGDAKEQAGPLDELERTAEAWATLAGSGFDLGLWDDIAPGQRRPLLPEDNEAFYQLLNRTSANWGVSPEPMVIPNLIRQPQSFVGRNLVAQAVVKQVTRVPSSAGDRATQLGLEQYFLLHAVVPLERPLRLKLNADQQLEYTHHFPIVIATRTLPQGLSVGDDVRQWIRGEGVFFKLWSYQSQKSQQQGLAQWAPLLIATEIGLESAPEPASQPWPIGGLLLIPLGLSLVFLLWAGTSSLRKRGK